MALRPSYLQTQINAGNAPNFKRFQDEGAWTNNARTDYTHTNHAAEPHFDGHRSARTRCRPACRQ